MTHITPSHDRESSNGYKMNNKVNNKKNIAKNRVYKFTIAKVNIVLIANKD